MATPCWARRESWCEGHCLKHANEKGLKKPESTWKACGDQAKKSKATNKKPQKKCKKSAQQANTKKDSGDKKAAPFMKKCVDQKILKNRRFGFLINTENHPALDLPIDENEKDILVEMQGDRAEAKFKKEQEPRDAKEGKWGN